MRRGVGVSALQNVASTQQRMANVGAQMDATLAGQLQENIELLERRLQDLARKHESLIRRDPLVRARLKQIADELGIDMLESQHTVFSKALGLGDYYFPLCVRIVEICLEERFFYGGMVPVARVLPLLTKWRPSDGIAEADVVYALDKLRVLGSGYEVVTVGSAKYIRATPEELSTDGTAVLTQASNLFAQQTKDRGGAADAPSVTKEQVMTGLGWSNVRAQAALDGLLRSGTAWVHRVLRPDGHPVVSYWFPFMT